MKKTKAKAKDVTGLVKKAMRSLGESGKVESQQELIRKTRKALGISNKELAEALDKSEDGLLAWLAPEGTKKFRKLPQEKRQLLVAILAQHRAKAK